MQTTTSTNLVNRYSSKLELAGKHHGRRMNGLYGKLLEFLLRKTEADRRVELFGSDPFK